jgi:hypothetical protein
MTNTGRREGSLGEEGEYKEMGYSALQIWNFFAYAEFMQSVSLRSFHDAFELYRSYNFKWSEVVINCE